MQHIAIFSSGNGTNAQRIIEHFNDHPTIRVTLLLCNNPDAYVLERARNLNVPSVVFTRHDLNHSHHLLDILSVQGIDFLILAGFLWLIPDYLLKAYPLRIINIHPALLPKYGGKGMYGMAVHQSVIEAEDYESGISIHYVNEVYDNGQIIFQAKCPVEPGDTAEMLAKRVHELEYRYYAEVIEGVVNGMTPPRPSPEGEGASPL